ncbi:MAG: hypothetical protein KatS3mg111_0417 [Pirellulaceae bacterium]|nr:MAG: hypothetical protein KatS3mg111_0417 [Pirellulaceae bacterium]
MPRLVFIRSASSNKHVILRINRLADWPPMHGTRDARAIGRTPQQRASLPPWRIVLQCFTRRF